MLVRLVNPADMSSLRPMLRDDAYEPTRDSGLLSYVNGEVHGFLAWRKAAVVHQFRVKQSLVSMKVAKALVEKAREVGRQLGIQEAIFILDKSNSSMIRLVESLGGFREKSGDIEEDRGLAYSLEL